MKIKIINIEINKSFLVIVSPPFGDNTQHLDIPTLIWYEKTLSYPFFIDKKVRLCYSINRIEE